MSRPTDPQTLEDIVVEAVLPHRPETVWKALTRSELIARWLMPNDFEARVGASFTFTTKPMGDWDGVVRCEVLEIEPQRRLVYAWRGGVSTNAAYGSPLDTIVTWTLTPVEDGTLLRLTHAGFRRPENDFAFEAMSRGWRRILEALDAAAASL